MLAPLAVNICDAPLQMVYEFAVKLMLGTDVTFTVTVAGVKFVQALASVPITLYTVVVVGLAVGVAILPLSKVAAGVQV